MIILLVFLEIIGLAILPHVLLSGKRSVSKLTWISVILLLPGIGPFGYLLIGNDRLRRRRLKRKANRLNQDQTEAQYLGSFQKVNHGEQKLLSTLAQLCKKPVSSISNIEHYYNGQVFYPALLTAIQKATQFIHIEVYLWHNDQTGQRILTELVNAALRGVRVCLLVDEIGSIEVSERFFSPLVEAGGKFSWFYTFHPRRNRYFFNLRNHRKLQVIDGNVAFIGGINIGLEYEGKHISTGEWKDMHLRLEGEIVSHLDEVFHRDWYFATDEELPKQENQPYVIKKHGDRCPTIIIESGPDANYGITLTSLLAIINYANKQLDLFTPYFVPEPSLVSALQIAVARGVKVRLMISKKNDFQFLVDIGRSFYEELLTAGVEIYEYNRCIHHSKMVIVDSAWFQVGSANLDARSMYLNFELGVFFKSQELCRTMEPYISRLFLEAVQVDQQRFSQRSLYQRLKQGFLGLWAPML
jgi:cardiolipin synthase